MEKKYFKNENNNTNNNNEKYNICNFYTQHSKHSLLTHK